MPSSCYIIYSKSLNTFYVGATQELVEQRLEKHNNQSYGKNHYTANANDWEVFLNIETVNYAHAIRIERKIKSMKSRKFFENLKKYPELSQKIFDQTCT